MKYILLSFILIFSIGANAQDIIGKWKTIDDNTGKARSIVEIYKKGDKVFGKVVKLFREPGEDPDPICEECSGKKKNQKVIGMEIITDMVFDADDNEYDKGEILDPENGKVYDCKLWVEDGKLKVRGYLYFLYRTQTWLPAE
ncbi:MAG: DUF2147 domain-containing protein [bacterium]|nr:DUF2147 domain-containing protein [bacterium]